MSYLKVEGVVLHSLHGTWEKEEAVRPERSVGEDARQVSPPFQGLSPLNLPLAPQMIQQVLVSEVPCGTSPGADQRILHDIK